jgi:hypothetical protein
MPYFQRLAIVIEQRQGVAGKFPDQQHDITLQFDVVFVHALLGVEQVIDGIVDLEKVIELGN